MHSFFYEDLRNAKAEDPIRLCREEENHLFRILRAVPGDIIRLLDGAGCVAEAEILPDRTVKIVSMRREPAPLLRLHLYFAPPRRQKTEQLLKQAAELGVSRIVSFFCERSVALPSGENALRRRDELLMEACKQSGNPFLPLSDGPMTFEQAVADASGRCPLRFFGSPAESSKIPEDLTGDCAFFVGPEGGFTPEEEEKLRTAGAKAIRIGHRILRVETAAVAGLAVLAAAEKEK